MINLPSPKQTLKIIDGMLPDYVVKKVEERLLAYKEGFADNTNRARAADYRVFKTWCDKNGLRPVPSTPEDIERFMWERVQQKKVDKITGEVKLKKDGKPIYEQIKAVATVERNLATIKYMHDVSYEVMQDLTDPYENAAKLKNPADTRRVRIALRAIKRKFRSKAQRQAAPIRLDLMEEIISTLTDSLRHTLYKALVSVAFDSMMRCSELVNIDLDHITFEDDGSAKVLVPFHKSDQEGEGSYRYLSSTSVTLIHNWITMAHIEEGLLFRSVNKANDVLDSMHKDRVAKIYKVIARLCGIKASTISAHSTRVGAAQELVTFGATMPELMLAGDWKSSAMPVRYAKKINVDKGAMATMSKVRGRS